MAKSLQSWMVLETAIPRGISERIAKAMHVSSDYVRRWRREALGDEAPTASGQHSPLDRVCDLIDAVFLANPQGACLIVDHVRAHYEELIDTHTGLGFSGSAHERAITAAKLLMESTEAINALNVEGATSNTIQQLLELRDAALRAINRTRHEIRLDEEKKDS